jgi:hypothetical protein
VDGVLRGDDRVGVAEVPRGVDARSPHASAHFAETLLRALGVGGDQDGEVDRAGFVPLTHGGQQRLAEHRLVRDHEHGCSLARRLQVDLYMLDGNVDRLASALDEVRPQPTRLQLPGMCGDDHLVRLVLVDGVLDRLERVGVDHGPARCDAGFVQEVERAPQPSLGTRAAAVRIDDEPRARLVLRRDDRDADRPGLRPLHEQVDEGLARDRLVRDDEDVPRLGANGRSPSPAPASRPGRRS